jgi:hypothetical protein
MSDAVGEHLMDHDGNEGVPVAHGNIDRERVTGLLEGNLQQASLGERPSGEGWGLGAGCVAETDLGVAVL